MFSLTTLAKKLFMPLFIFAVVLFSVYYLFVRNSDFYNKTSSPLTTLELNKKISTTGEFSRIGECTKEACLFMQDDGVIEGLAHITGYYTEVERMAWDIEPVTCSSLVVTGGNDVLINNFKKWVEVGNTLNKLDDEGNLLLAISIDGLSTNDKSRIMNSTADSPVNLYILNKMPRRGTADRCPSFVDVIAVNVSD